MEHKKKKKNNDLAQYKKIGSEGNLLNIILFVFHKELFYQLDTHIVMISIVMISGSWKMEGWNMEDGGERFEDLLPPKTQRSSNC